MEGCNEWGNPWPIGLPKQELGARSGRVEPRLQYEHAMYPWKEVQWCGSIGGVMLVLAGEEVQY